MKRKSLTKIILLVLLGLGFLLVLTVFYYGVSVNRKNYDGDGAADFIVLPGQKVYEIAENLRKVRLINSTTAFKIYVRINNLASKLQAGYYRLPRDLSIKEIVDELQHGKFDLKLTFPEGWRREEMAFYAAKQVNGGDSFYEEFLKESQGLEGFLFPETYIVPREVSAKDLVKVMKETSRKKLGELTRTGGLSEGLSEKEVMILASIVEREARKDEDRPIIAGIFIKRLKNGWPLEADATVQYAVASRNLDRVGYSDLESFEFWPKQITLDDLKYDSPFNTRRHQGLPPQPICNPGKASVEAVYQAVETPYWFYLNDTRGDTHFAKTLDEHTRNVDKF